jgi:hypothetical protein
MSRIFLAPLALLIALICLAVPKRVLSHWITTLQASLIPIGEATELEVEVIVL